MSVWIDTSGFYALLDADDPSHDVARGLWDRLLEEKPELVTNNYVFVETVVILQRRLGLGAVTEFVQEFVPLVSANWVDEDIHGCGLVALLAAGRRKVSMVDCVSFEQMRRLGITEALAFAAHFDEQGFHCLRE